MESMEGSPFLRRFFAENLFDELLARGDIPPQGIGREGVQPGGKDPSWLVQGFSARFSHSNRADNHFHTLPQNRP